MLRVAIWTAVAVRPRANFDTQEDNMMIDIGLIVCILQVYCLWWIMIRTAARGVNKRCDEKDLSSRESSFGDTTI